MGLLLLVGAWSAALASAAAASIEDFTVLYTGDGTLSSRLKSQTSPQCGEVTEVRNETTHFSWVTNYAVTLRIGSAGLGGETVMRQAKPSALVENSSTVTLSDTGCQPGIANCKGDSQPQPGHDAVLDIPGARPGGSSRLKVQAVGGFLGFTGKAFSGGWGFPSGSCAIQFNNSTLLEPEFAVPGQLEAEFPVKVATFKSLPRGHYFRVKISPGHYSPAQHNSCFASDGCLKDSFSWQGEVKFTRVS